MSPDDDVKLAEAAMHRVVEEQVRKGDPAETGLTLARLRRNGYSRLEAIRLIAAVLANEIWKVAEHDDRRFDEASYLAALRELPALPWE